jgi:hypothetical protein
MDPATISQTILDQSGVQVMDSMNSLDYYNDGSDKRDASSRSTDIWWTQHNFTNHTVETVVPEGDSSIERLDYYNDGWINGMPVQDPMMLMDPTTISQA